ncbi:hypothetical protein CIK05_06720 [Bdellovibrio sp. qaytius]|nr:hypothetical protein CIK05_06690 [Bdellovibrio sp. qaytius]AZZ36494.1 hypothetical protein CIK05_06720 [Bdellovibrio sp. qaytius]
MSSKIEIEVNSNSYIVNSGLHDATIENINVNCVENSKRVSVECRAEDGRLFTLDFNDVVFFDINFLGRQNVIRDITVLSKKSAKKFLSEISNLESYTFHKIDDLELEIISGELTFVQFSASVGADLRIICKKIEMSSI